MPTYRLFGAYGGLSPTYKLITTAMGRMPNWHKHDGHKDTRHDYSNGKTRITTFARTNKDVTGKMFLAKLLRDAPYIPETHVIKEGRLSSHPSDPRGKWFMKPDDNFGGKGIRVLAEAHEWKEHAKHKDWVLQRGVTNLLLYEGRKFDLRIWVHIVYKARGAYDVYLHRDAGYLRIAKPIYSESSTSRNTNLTNNSWQDKVRSTSDPRSGTNNDKSMEHVYINDLWRTQSFHAATYTKVANIVKDVFKRLRSYWRKPIDANGFEIMGFDFLVDNDMRVKLLEINRHLGYPIINQADYNPAVREMAIQTSIDLINDFVEPLLKGEPYKNDEKWMHLLQW